MIDSSTQYHARLRHKCRSSIKPRFSASNLLNVSRTRTQQLHTRTGPIDHLNHYRKKLQQYIIPIYTSNMAPWWNSKRPEYSGSTSEPNLVSDPQPEQSSRLQTPQEPALLAPPRSRRRHVVDKLKGFVSSSPSPSPSPSPCPSPSPSIGRRDKIIPIPTSTSTSQSLMVPANAAVRPHSSYSGGSTPKTRDPSPLTAGANVTTAVSTGNHGSPSPSYILYQSAHLLRKYRKQISSEILTSPPACAVKYGP